MMPRRHLFALLALLWAALLPAVASAKEPFASDRIAVTVAGSGSDVILIPGLSSSPRVWAELVAAVPGHRYHMVQVSGFAGTPAGGNGAGPVAAPVAEEIARYIAANGLKKPAVIGHSMGGTIGMMLAARHPDAVSKLMIVDMMPFMGAMFGGPGATPETVRPIADQILAAMTGPESEGGRKQLEATINGMINTISMRQGALDDSFKSDRNVSARAFHELVVTDLGPELPSITAPTTLLYVTPTGAPFTDAQIDSFYAAAYAPLERFRLIRVHGAAHFIMWDAPDRFQSEVWAFLDQG